MKYADLKAVMVEFRAGNIEREDMVAAIALWQRPVEITKEAYEKALKKYKENKDLGMRFLFDDMQFVKERKRAAVEAVIR